MATLPEAIAGELAENAGAWFTDDEAVGSRDVICGNALRSGRTTKPRIGLIAAIVDATALDASLRALWRETVLQPQIESAARAIRRDQVAGQVPGSIGPDATVAPEPSLLTIDDLGGEFELEGSDPFGARADVAISSCPDSATFELIAQRTPASLCFQCFSFPS